MEDGTMKHTPGPWKVLEHPEQDIAIVGIDGQTLWFYSEYPPMDERRWAVGFRRADARLIAAAPDLLAACEAAVGEIEGGCYSAAAAILTYAIAKAKGGPGDPTD